ncbi:MAG: hypothetical protein U0805_19125 [Pirellulales bacterium]
MQPPVCELSAVNHDGTTDTTKKQIEETSFRYRNVVLVVSSWFKFVRLAIGRPRPLLLTLLDRIATDS